MSLHDNVSLHGKDDQLVCYALYFPVYIKVFAFEMPKPALMILLVEPLFREHVMRKLECTFACAPHPELSIGYMLLLHLEP